MNKTDMKALLKGLVNEYVDQVFETEDPKTIKDTKATDRLKDFMLYLEQTQGIKV